MQRLLAVILVSLSLASCSTVTGGPLVRSGEPIGYLEVINRSQYTLTSILISDCSAMSYGLNRLPSGVTVPPGRSYRFTLSAGCWDVGAGLAYHDAYERLQVRAGRVTRYTLTG